MTKPCEQCGQLFSKRYPSLTAAARFCSRSCRTIWLTDPINGHDCQCKECGAWFRSRKSNHTFCSQRCAGRVSHRNIRTGGNWDEVLKRDGYKCRLCERTASLVVHHLDGTGESSVESGSNHNLANLVVVCRPCHQKIHRMTYIIKDGVIVVDNPMFKLIGMLPMVALGQLVKEWQYAEKA